jgi:hypothetical protein
MQLLADQGIRRRPDGSIDTGYYMSRGRAARAEQARSLFVGSAGGGRVDPADLQVAHPAVAITRAAAALIAGLRNRLETRETRMAWTRPWSETRRA